MQIKMTNKKVKKFEDINVGDIFAFGKDEAIVGVWKVLNTDLCSNNRCEAYDKCPGRFIINRVEDLDKPNTEFKYICLYKTVQECTFNRAYEIEILKELRFLNDLIGDD